MLEREAVNLLETAQSPSTVRNLEKLLFFNEVEYFLHFADCVFLQRLVEEDMEWQLFRACELINCLLCESLPFSEEVAAHFDPLCSLENVLFYVGSVSFSVSSFPFCHRRVEWISDEKKESLDRVVNLPN